MLECEGLGCCVGLGRVELLCRTGQGWVVVLGWAGLNCCVGVGRVELLCWGGQG